MSRRQSQESLRQTISDDENCPRTHLFMVRIWLEDLGEGKAEWRGQVKHVMSGEVQYFREWTALINHILEMSSSYNRLLNNSYYESNIGVHCKTLQTDDQQNKKLSGVGGKSE